MKRIEKISNFYGVDLIRESGEKFSFGADEVESLSYEKVGGRTYSCFNLVNGFKIIYRNTLQCTYYEILENTSDEVACSVEEELIDVTTFKLNDFKETAIGDFYNIKFKDLLTLENDNFISFALSDYNGNVYVPIRKDQEAVDTEICAVLKEEYVEKIIIEKQEIGSKICPLKRESRIFDKDEYILSTSFGEKVYALNKKSCDAVLRLYQEGKPVIGFLNDKEVIVPVRVETSFFEVLYINEYNFDEIKDGYVYLYKRYKKNKKTKGITDIKYKTAFSFFNF